MLSNAEPSALLEQVDENVLDERLPAALERAQHVRSVTIVSCELLGRWHDGGPNCDVELSEKLRTLEALALLGTGGTRIFWARDRALRSPNSQIRQFPFINIITLIVVAFYYHINFICL